MNWNQYKQRMEIKGYPQKNGNVNRASRFINRKLPSSPSYQSAFIQGLKQDIAIINREKTNIKDIHALPGENIPRGALVYWNEQNWLITEVDSFNEIYVSGVMQQCNYCLHWINNNGKQIKRYCIVEDGTKYLVGEKEKELMSIGDARISLTIGKDQETVHFSRGRRFLIDDPDSEQVLAYEITKPNKLFGLYQGEGVYKFILSETNTTDYDNKELMIADYYKHYPKDIPPPTKPEVWI